MCKSWCEFIIAVIVIVFTFWQIPGVSQWIVGLAAVGLILHSMTCKSCFAGERNSAIKKKR